MTVVLPATLKFAAGGTLDGLDTSSSLVNIAQIALGGGQFGKPALGGFGVQPALLLGQSGGANLELASLGAISIEELSHAHEATLPALMQGY